MLMARHFMTRIIIPAIISLLPALSVNAMEFSKPSDAVELRQSQMDLISSYFGDMGAMVKNNKPFNAEQFKVDAERLAVLASWANTGYEKASYTNSDSEASPAIWKNKAEYDQMMAKFMADTKELSKVAAGGDLKASLPAFKAVASNCSSCHKKFKD